LPSLTHTCSALGRKMCPKDAIPMPAMTGYFIRIPHPASAMR